MVQAGSNTQNKQDIISKGQGQGFNDLMEMELISPRPAALSESPLKQGRTCQEGEQANTQNKAWSLSIAEFQTCLDSFISPHNRPCTAQPPTGKYRGCPKAR